MKDRTGNQYIESDNTRVTLVKNRPSNDKDWTGGSTVRIQAKRGSGGLHMGCEVPLEDMPTILKGIAELLIASEA
jgi:hypothetical protein